jgi:uncharacterized membrane-anchored protein YitT (DUF2179 family)
MKLGILTILREFKDYLFIFFGLVCYAMGWTAFLLPYQITTGGVTGVAAIIFYATGFPLQYSYFAINAVLIGFAFKILGFKFTIKTAFGIFSLTFLLGFFQKIVGHTKIIGEDQEFMACVLGSAICGIGLAIAFLNNGSTGGTDIIAAIVNKYRDVTFGRMILYCDVVIISSCYFVFHDWKRVVFGFVTLTITSYVLDLIINSARQSVQFFIFSKEYDKIADRISSDTHRGVTVLDATGWYSKNEMKVLMVLAKKNQSVFIFRMVKDIDPSAFISQSSVIGVYGEGFDKIKVK